MYDTNDLVRAVQQMSTDANNASYPSDVMSGTVVSVKPIKIEVEQRFEVSGDMVIVPEHLTDHEIKVTVEKTNTEKAGDPEHQHEYGGELVIKVHGALQKGDRVQMIRQQGGQKFLIIDKVV